MLLVVGFARYGALVGTGGLEPPTQGATLPFCR